MRAYRDRDFVQTPEGLFFCVIGNVHPRDRVLAYLKYLPSTEGKWGGEARYVRALRAYTTPSVEESLETLRARYPHYIHQSETLNIEISAVPLSYVRTHFKPEKRLSTLLTADSTGLDELEKRTVNLVQDIAEISGVDPSFLGVTGSILLGIHNPSFSDIDLIVYGRINVLQVKEAISFLFGKSLANRLSEPSLEEWAFEKSKLYPLSPGEAKEIARRKWDRGVYQGTFFSVHAVKLEEEVEEKYGERIYEPEGLATIHARVADVKDAYFLPATYRVDDVTVVEGRNVDNVLEITTYDGLYSDLYEVGEKIVARGKLELVLDKHQETSYHRLLIGSFEAGGRDYIKPILKPC